MTRLERMMKTYNNILPRTIANDSTSLIRQVSETILCVIALELDNDELERRRYINEPDNELINPAKAACDMAEMLRNNDEQDKDS